MIFYANKIRKFLTLAILPIFLFGLVFPMPTKAENSEMKIIFALKNADKILTLSNKYDIKNRELIFQAKENLPATYKGIINTSVFDDMQKDYGFYYVEQDSKVSSSQLSSTPIVTANDPFFATEATSENNQWYLPKIRMPEAWNYGTGNGLVTVAIIDTGIHSAHLDLNDGRVVAGFNTITDEIIPAAANSDDNGHGTAVAGVIGAISNNSKGTAGINWDVKLMPVKALNSIGEGEISVVAESIVWAADNGAQIINLSLGGPGFGNDQTLNNSIIYAFNKGAVIVAAVGNDQADHGINLDTNPIYPVCADGGSNMVIGVAASDIADRKASFSNFGINCIDITAPGKRIITTAYLPSDPSDNLLIYGSGTSLATPIVSGVASLLKSNNPKLTNTEIRDIIINTADNIDAINQGNCFNSSCTGFLGKGRLNALNALSPKPILDGTYVREAATGKVYLVTGGSKKYVSSFVLSQRSIPLTSIINETDNQLAIFKEGPGLPPLPGTLIKSQTDPTVYYIHQEVKRPLTFLVFMSRGFSFANVKAMPDSDVDAITTGEWYWPPDGTMVLIKDNPTVYVMDQSVRRPVTYFVFIQRRLSFGKVVSVTLDEFSHIPKAPDPYWLAPLDGTLVKGPNDPTVFVIEQASKRPISGEAFLSRRYRYSNIKTLPEAEMDVIAPGAPIIGI